MLQSRPFFFFHFCQVFGRGMAPLPPFPLEPPTMKPIAVLDLQSSCSACIILLTRGHCCIHCERVESLQAVCRLQWGKVIEEDGIEFIGMGWRLYLISLPTGALCCWQSDCKWCVICPGENCQLFCRKPPGCQPGRHLWTARCGRCESVTLISVNNINVYWLMCKQENMVVNVKERLTFKSLLVLSIKYVMLGD